MSAVGGGGLQARALFAVQPPTWRELLGLASGIGARGFDLEAPQRRSLTSHQIEFAVGRAQAARDDPKPKSLEPLDAQRLTQLSNLCVVVRSERRSGPAIACAHGRAGTRSGGAPIVRELANAGDESAEGARERREVRAGRSESAVAFAADAV